MKKKSALSTFTNVAFSAILANFNRMLKCSHFQSLDHFRNMPLVTPLDGKSINNCIISKISKKNFNSLTPHIWQSLFLLCYWFNFFFTLVDAMISQWSSWTQCSVSCDGGVETAERHCTPPKFGGVNCSESNLEMTRACNEHKCSGKIIFWDFFKLNRWNL